MDKFYQDLVSRHVNLDNADMGLFTWFSFSFSFKRQSMAGCPLQCQFPSKTRNSTLTTIPSCMVNELHGGINMHAAGTS